MANNKIIIKEIKKNEIDKITIRKARAP